MNNNIDNYIDSLENWDAIEFEGDTYIFRKFNDKLNIIECDNYETIKMNEFYDDLEFWENRLFHK